MMMAIIHMETEAVESTIAQLRRSFFELEENVQDLQRNLRFLRSAWQGGNTSSEFYQEMEALLRRWTDASDSLGVLEIRLKSEYQEWLQADAAFGFSSVGTAIQKSGAGSGSASPLTLDDLRKTICGIKSGGDKTRCEDIWSHPPETYEQLAYMIMNLPEDQPIVIMQIGDGEYLVLLRGTVGLEDAGHNWGSAVESMFGNSSYQNSVIEALKNANLPDGAKLNFAGHSQGGMVAQNLAVDPRVTGKFDVETVTMFGSPDTWSSANPGTNYVSIENNMDFVPKIDEMLEGRLTRDDWEKTKNFDPHGYYDDPGELSDYKTPFQNVEWNPVQISGTEVTTIGPKIYKLVIDVSSAAKEIANGIANM